MVASPSDANDLASGHHQEGYLPAVIHLKLHHPALFSGLDEYFVGGMYSMPPLTLGCSKCQQSEKGINYCPAIVDACVDWFSFIFAGSLLNGCCTMIWYHATIWSGSGSRTKSEKDVARCCVEGRDSPMKREDDMA